MGSKKRGSVWLGAAGLVVNEAGKWLVVRKTYGGLKGIWSLPAGFVDEGETADEAAMREVYEETGIASEAVGLIGFRTGVLAGDVSDNLAIFMMKALNPQDPFIPSPEEIAEVAWKSPQELKEDPNVTSMLHQLAEDIPKSDIYEMQQVNPGDWFGYKRYKLFFTK